MFHHNIDGSLSLAVAKVNLVMHLQRRNFNLVPCPQATRLALAELNMILLFIALGMSFPFLKFDLLSPHEQPQLWWLFMCTSLCTI